MMELMSLKEEHQRACFLSLSLHHLRVQQEGNHLQSRKRTFSSEFNRVGTLTLDFQRCEKMNFYCFSHPGCVNFAMAAQAD